MPKIKDASTGRYIKTTPPKPVSNSVRFKVNAIVKEASETNPESVYVFVGGSDDLDPFENHWEACFFLTSYLKRGRNAYGTAIKERGHLVKNGKIIETITIEDVEEDPDEIQELNFDQ